MILLLFGNISCKGFIFSVLNISLLPVVKVASTARYVQLIMSDNLNDIALHSSRRKMLRGWQLIYVGCTKFVTRYQAVIQSKGDFRGLW